MKLLLALLATIFLSQPLIASGGVGEDPNLPHSSTPQAGSTFTSAVGQGNQPVFCEKCEERTSARLSNNVGKLTTTIGGSSSGSGTTGTPANSEQ